MNGFWKTLRIVGMAAFTLGALTTSARANPVLDFKTGLADQGGTVLLFSDVSGSGIPIGTAAGTSTANAGNATESAGDTYGSLKLATGSTGIGSAGSPVTLTSSSTGNGLGNAGGWGLDSPLGTLLGLSTDLQYTFLGWSVTNDPLSVGTPGTALSTDIRNTAVPEPGSIFLLGSGLLYAAGSIRRRLNQ